MIISPGRRYIFVHIPKTGGTALALALEARAMKDDILIGDTPKAKRRRRRVQALAPKAQGRLWKHATLADIDGLLPPDEFARMRVFTIVRNPWERMASYWFWLREQAFDHEAVRLARTLPFPDFIRHPAIAGPFAAWPAAAYVTTAAGEERCDLFLRHERLAADAALLGEMLGMRLPTLPVVNRSARPADWRRLYRAADVDHLARLAAADIARFGYSFE